MRPPPANFSTRLARRVVDGLVGVGVQEFVLAPGSRNAPLAFAAWDASRADRLRLHTRLDERSAGFLALGMSKSRGPAAVMCTSGTAVANLHPAVLEAAHAGVPLVVVTADRPAALRGTGASQTTDQVRIFGDAADFFDIASEADFEGARETLAALDRGCRPVHLNVQLTPPLTPDAPWEGRFKPDAPDAPDESDESDGPDKRASARRHVHTPRPHELARGPRTVVVAGDDAGPRTRVLAESAGWPLLAEPSSGSRNGDN
ncbi:MAG: 2-succinyl-5-enolpyruvyl-6-hydroxy-3-cyclohexene-1-carboxylic-acid synthase, partial [Nocardioides sp.]|nr:2-succinyl-5-enolpyruvyl-6-hydroxy-3-cyclohexene-1-carboxylic-acid synthase [Nocardioides sp.]